MYACMHAICIPMHVDVCVFAGMYVRKFACIGIQYKKSMSTKNYCT